ncbi:collagen binding domain-containing protein [Candidatus Latescibacterota bacterium]
MKSLFSLVITATVTCLLLYSCSENENNPVAPENTTGTITGYIYNLILGHGIPDVTVHIVGGNIDSTVYTDENGVFLLGEIHEGEYIVKPSSDGFMFGPSEQRIIAYDGTISADFLGLTADRGLVIAGKIVTEEGHPVHNVTMWLKNIDISDPVERIKKSHRTPTNAKGYYVFMYDIEMGANYSITMEKPGYDYVFSSDSSFITVSDKITVAHCEARNTGEPLQSITGKVVNAEMYEWIASVFLKQNGSILIMSSLDTSGEYAFYGLKSGKYTLEFLTPRYGDFRLDTNEVAVDLTDKDIIVPDINAYNRTTDYTVSGKIVDETGTGIESTHIMFSRTEPAWFKSMQTDANGYFDQTDTLSENEERTYNIIPSKEGFSFSPDTLSVQVHWIKGETETEITLPDIIGHDYSKIIDSSYFPLTIGTSWTYLKTDRDGTTTEHTTTITETVTHNNITYFRMSESGPCGFIDYRIDGNDVYALDGDSDILFLRFGVTPDETWESGVKAGTYLRFGTFLGLKTVETPSGTYDNCAHFLSNITYSDDSFESYDLWYAKDIGLVKSVHIEQSYGEVIERVTLELLSYE